MGPRVGRRVSPSQDYIYQLLNYARVRIGCPICNFILYSQVSYQIMTILAYKVSLIILNYYFYGEIYDYIFGALIITLN